MEDDEAYKKTYAKWQRRAQLPVMPNFCHARTWKGCQCEKPRSKDSQLCSMHRGQLNKTKALKFGVYGTDTMRPEQLHARLRRAAVCDSATKAFRYYSRDRMWEGAKKLQKTCVEDLDEDDFLECLSLIHI